MAARTKNVGLGIPIPSPSMDQSLIMRSALSATVFAAVSLVLTGGDVATLDIAIEAGIQAAAAASSDMVHSAIGRENTPLSSAVVTGALFTVYKAVGRGNTDYAMNLGASAATDFIAAQAQLMLMPVA